MAEMGEEREPIGLPFSLISFTNMSSVTASGEKAASRQNMST